jgi:hypothetical protein
MQTILPLHRHRSADPGSDRAPPATFDLTAPLFRRQPPQKHPCKRMKKPFVIAAVGLAIGFALSTVAQQTNIQDPDLGEVLVASCCISHNGGPTISARPFNCKSEYLYCAPSVIPPVVVKVLIPNVCNDCCFVSPILTGGNTKENLRKFSLPPEISVPPNVTLISDPIGPSRISISSLKNVKNPSGPL